MVRSRLLEQTPSAKARCVPLVQLLILSLPVFSSGNEDDDRRSLVGWL